MKPLLILTWIVCEVDMQQKQSKEEKLKESLQIILAQEDITQCHELVKRLSTELQVSILDCAAALIWLNQPPYLRVAIEREMKRKR